MVRSKIYKAKGRAAFSLIELIFAMVVISVSVMSLPMMTQVTSKGMEGNIVQEAIFASVSEINFASSGMWDDNSIIEKFEVGEAVYFVDDLSRVIDVSSTCISLTGKTRRLGHINRKCVDDNTIGVSKLNEDDISLEFFKHDVENIYEDYSDDSAGKSSSSGYKKVYNSKLEVNYCADGNCKQFGVNANDPDMKEIVITMTDEDNETVTLLRTYATNIGEVKYARKPL